MWCITNNNCLNGIIMLCVPRNRIIIVALIITTTITTDAREKVALSRVIKANFVQPRSDMQFEKYIIAVINFRLGRKIEFTTDNFIMENQGK